MGAAEALISVVFVNDSISETIETVELALNSNAAYVTDPGALKATLSLVDDDLQILNVIASDAAAAERDLSIAGTAADTATFLITRTGDTTLPLTVYYTMPWRAVLPAPPPPRCMGWIKRLCPA